MLAKVVAGQRCYFVLSVFDATPGFVCRGCVEVMRSNEPAVGYGRFVTSTKKLFKALTRRGPHRVLRGDLAVLNDRGKKLRRAIGLCHSSDADERRYVFDVRMKLPKL